MDKLIVYMNRLVRNNLATKPVNGKISFINDDFIMASQLIYPSYIINWTNIKKTV